MCVDGSILYDTEREREILEFDVQTIATLAY